MAAKGVRLVVGDVPADAIARGDRKKIHQVLLNLLSNAMKFTEPGGEVGIATVVGDGAVRIDVRDTGSGISAAQLEAIFEPFVQVDASLTRRAGGTGLGLAIARQLTRAMGGTRRPCGAPLGAGSTFSLTLPRAGAASASTRAAPHAARDQPGRLSVSCADCDSQARRTLAIFPIDHVRERREMSERESTSGSAVAGARQTEVAVLAGGCFWGVEDILRDVRGVIETDVGYTGGWLENPTYHDTHDSKSGHAEAVRITFDPTVLSYEDLLEKWFFRLHDPTTLNRQGNDIGTQYRSAIFPQSDEQRATARARDRARRTPPENGAARSPPPSSPPPPGTAPSRITRTICGRIRADIRATFMRD